jgi:DNA processing protein
MRKSKNIRVIHHLFLISGVSPSLILRILSCLYQEKYPELIHVGWEKFVEHQDDFDLESLYHYSVTDFTKKVGLSDIVAQMLVTGLADKTALHVAYDQMQKHDIGVVSILNDEYPEILKQISVPPVVLYYQGEPFAPAAKRIAFVGARKASGYAQRVVNNLIPGLIAHGWDIVSGGALGADAMAHQATLEVGGRTIAVLGSGLLQQYPATNKDLFARMIESGGTMVSPFPLDLHPDKGTFPARNRVIAGLSLGCVIVQAAEKSGALITAKFALEQGRQVFAVPGPIDEELSVGCNGLIKEGAKLVNHVNDILEEFGEYYASAKTSRASKDNTHQMNIVSAATKLEYTDPILNCLSVPATFDELIEKTGFEAFILQDRLFSLQLDGKVRQNFVGTWERIEGW